MLFTIKKKKYLIPDHIPLFFIPLRFDNWSVVVQLLDIMSRSEIFTTLISLSLTAL